MKLMQRTAELDGFAGSMTRLREAYDTLNQTFPLAWSPDELIDVMQTGDRLSYHPETASAEIKRFHAALPRAIDKVHAMATAITPEKQAELVKTIGSNWHSDRLQQQVQNYQAKIARGSAQLQDGLEEGGTTSTH